MKLLTSTAVALTVLTATSGMATASAAPTAHAKPVQVRMDAHGHLVSSSTHGNEVRLVSVAKRGGSQTNILIANRSATQVYEFTYAMPRGEHLVKARNGSVLVERGHHVVAVIAMPWAHDAKGHAVKTQFAVKGNTVTQTVNFSAHNAFPIIADPWWNPMSWNWGKMGHTALNRLSSCGLSGTDSKGSHKNVKVKITKGSDGRDSVQVGSHASQVITKAVGNCISHLLH